MMSGEITAHIFKLAYRRSYKCIDSAAERLVGHGPYRSVHRYEDTAISKMQHSCIYLIKLREHPDALFRFILLTQR